MRQDSKKFLRRSVVNLHDCVGIFLETKHCEVFNSAFSRQKFSAVEENNKFLGRILQIVNECLKIF